jgi:hypothetical protein
MIRATFKAIVAGFITVGALTAIGGVASAAQPVVQACVGTTHSGDAHAFGPGSIGHISSTFAQQPGTAHPGLGDGIQLLQAGQVSDNVVANTCN